MLGDEELIFYGKYKTFNFGKRFDLSNANQADVAAALLYTSNNIEQAGYAFCGIDCAAIEKVVKKFDSIGAMCDYLNKGEFKKALESAAKDKNLIPAAESYFLNILFAKNNIQIKPNLALNLKSEDYEEPGRIVFIGKYKDWSVIKKLALSEVDYDWEVAGIIASANMTAVKKAFQFAMQDYQKLVEDAKKLADKKRKSFSAAAEIIRIASNNPVLLTTALEELGYYPYLTLFVLMDAYPDLKPKKPKGRMPKS